MQRDDKKLIKNILSGDMKSFEQLIEIYQSRVYLACLRFMKNEYDAKDMAQEVFIKIYNKLGDFRFKSNFSTWLYSLCASTCLDQLRKRKRITLVELQDIHFMDNGSKPEDLLESKELTELIMDELEKYDVKTADVIKRRLINEEPYAKIAKESDIPVSSARTYFTRGRKKLMKSIKSYVEED